jgi:hypothetical protein
MAIKYTYTKVPFVSVPYEIFVLIVFPGPTWISDTSNMEGGGAAALGGG